METQNPSTSQIFTPPKKIKPSTNKNQESHIQNKTQKPKDTNILQSIQLHRQHQNPDSPNPRSCISRNITVEQAKEKEDWSG